METITRSYAKARNLPRYFTGKLCVNGHTSERRTSDGHCLQCNKDRDQERYASRREASLQYLKEYRLKNSASLREKDRVRNKKPERHKSRMVSNRVRETLIRRSMVYPHEREDILNFYKNRPEGHHVHHMIPLQGSTVCGLTVLSNLTYLPAVENMSLGNRFDPDEWSL